MYVGKARRQNTVASKGKEHARAAQDIARDVAERGDGGAGEKEDAAEVAQENRSGAGQRGKGVIGKRSAEGALRNQLDEDVKSGR